MHPPHHQSYPRRDSGFDCYALLYCCCLRDWRWLFAFFLSMYSIYHFRVQFYVLISQARHTNLWFWVLGFPVLFRVCPFSSTIRFLAYWKIRPLTLITYCCSSNLLCIWLRSTSCSSCFHLFFQPPLKTHQTTGRSANTPNYFRLCLSSSCWPLS